MIPPQLTLPLEQLVPLPGQFRTRSHLHGQDHVARVMVHAFRLVAATGLADHAACLWGAVYLHDLERRHDGRCHEHGRWAWERFTRDADLQAHLAAGGVTRADWPAIQTAVTAHSRPQEIPGDDPHRVLTALLKDADALDRVRIDDLDPGYLRFPAAGEMERFAWALLDRTRDLERGPGLFARVLEQAAGLGCQDAGSRP